MRATGLRVLGCAVFIPLVIVLGIVSFCVLTGRLASRMTGHQADLMAPNRLENLIIYHIAWPWLAAAVEAR